MEDVQSLTTKYKGMTMVQEQHGQKSTHQAHSQETIHTRPLLFVQRSQVVLLQVINTDLEWLPITFKAQSHRHNQL